MYHIYIYNTLQGTSVKLNKQVIAWFIFLHLGALLAFLPSTFSWSAVGLFVFMYWLTASVGVCFGFHRYLTHRGMIMPKWLDYFIIFCGTLACQNGPLKWVAQHRMHHDNSDTLNDPHNIQAGFLWAHMGWMFYNRHQFDNSTRLRKFTRDINKDKFYQFLDKYFIHIQIALGIVFYLIGGISWVVWGIFVRLVLVYHATWCVNSVCHKWGYTNYRTSDLSKNNYIIAILTFGEGWHSNHHKIPRSVKHGIKKHEIDLTYYLIYGLSKLGLVSNLKVYS